MSGAERPSAGVWRIGGPTDPGDWVDVAVGHSSGVLIAATRQAAVVWVDLPSGQVRMRRPEAEACAGSLCPAVRLGVGDESWGMVRALTLSDAAWERSGFDGSRGGGPLMMASENLWSGGDVHIEVESKWGPGRRPVVIDVDRDVASVVQPPSDVRVDRWAISSDRVVWSTWKGDLVEVRGGEVSPVGVVGGGRLRDLSISRDGRVLVALSGVGSWHVFQENGSVREGVFDFPPAGLKPVGGEWMLGWSRRAVICYSATDGTALGSWPIQATGPVRSVVDDQRAWVAVPGQGVAELNLAKLCNG